MDGALSEGLGENKTDVLGANASEPEPTIESEIASMGKIMEEQCEILNNAIQQNTPLYVQNAEPMEANQEYRRG